MDPPSNAITLVVIISTYRFGGGTSIQSIIRVQDEHYLTQKEKKILVKDPFADIAQLAIIS